ncbi:MAG: hypothetical protein EA353_09585 [Puniceicoccaceae bacterium]|nr:MAG: hypothetical protein EA353_09585 [Puniceicoccaceae bacterium]
MVERKNPSGLSTLWYKPKQSMQGLIESGRGHGFALSVAIAFGVVQAMPLFLLPDSGGLGVLLGGALAGLAGLYLFAWLLRNFARWFGGQAALREVRMALGVSFLPWLLLFTAVLGFLQSFEREVLAQYFWIFFLVFLYGYIVILNCLSAALRLPLLKTFLCLIVTGLVSLFPLTLLLQVLTGGTAPTP